MKIKLFKDNYSVPKFELTCDKIDHNYIMKNNDLYSLYLKNEKEAHFVCIPLLKVD